MIKTLLQHFINIYSKIQKLLPGSVRRGAPSKSFGNVENSVCDTIGGNNDTVSLARAGSEVDLVQRDLAAALIQLVGRHPKNASTRDWFQSVAYFARGRMADCWLEGKAALHGAGVKTVYYLSMEYLIGRSLRNHLFNLGLENACRNALAAYGVDLEQVYEEEHDAALGNGGLGRLAACLLDSLTTQGYPAYGYGIRYDSGIFAQEIEDGWQVERPDDWLKYGNPWEFVRPSKVYHIPFGGHLMTVNDSSGETRALWRADKEVIAVAHDLQVSGFGHKLVNTIRLWKAKSVEEFNLGHFNQGDHIGAMHEKSDTEALSRVLYPDDTTQAGRALRLRQEYFFVSASLQDIIDRFQKSKQPLSALPDRVAIQLNDTHPALAIPEMMRLLIDVHGLDWDMSWTLTKGVFSYTNHTLLPEALETWPVPLLQEYLPRHLDIIYKINDLFLKSVAEATDNDHDLIRRVSFIEENDERSIRMSNLAVVGSHRVNGVSKLHTDIMKQETFADFERLFPDRIVNKTNGIVSRRWLNQANPGLAELVSSLIGDRWLNDLNHLQDLACYAEDAQVRARFRAAKTTSKTALAMWLAKEHGTMIDRNSMFDVQIKRFHEYKRQLLNILYVVDRYNRLRHGRIADPVPRTVIFAGKAAPSYQMAKLIIKLICDCAKVINADPAVNGVLKVVFIPNYGVSIAEKIIPAAELSQQISVAGAEASGTGNMKLALNGALTLGTRDGANLEIGEAVGNDNIFFFGLSAAEVAERRQSGHNPYTYCETNLQLQESLDMIANGFFSPGDPHLFAPICDSLLKCGDHFMVLSDYAAYAARQADVDACYREIDVWDRKALINVAGMPQFSSDRTIRDYACEVWGLSPVDPEDEINQSLANERQAIDLAN